MNEIDTAINKFRDYAQGKGDFDELDLKEVIYNIRNEALWDLHEYMGQFPDDLNLAVMDERIKEIENE